MKENHDVCYESKILTIADMKETLKDSDSDV
jgi:hypothetical protein